MVDQRLSHLSSLQLADLIERYVRGTEPIKALIEEFALELHPSSLSAALPPEEMDETCPYCEGVRLLRKQPRRGAQQWEMPNPTCPSCGHGKQIPCRCSNCRDRASRILNAETQLKRQAIERGVAVASRAVTVSDLSFKQALSILSLAQHSVSDDYKSVDPYDIRPVPLTPTGSMTFEVVANLYREALIGISPASDTKAFEFDAEITTFEKFYPTQVKWRFLPSMSVDQARDLVRAVEMIFRDSEWPDEWFADVDRMWRQIVLEECLEYFSHMMAQRGFDGDINDERVRDVVDRALGHFAPAQVVNLIWQSARDCVDYMATKGIPARQAQAVCRGILDRKIDKHVAEKWVPRNSRRDFQCPQSAISLTLFNTVLQLGERAFNEKSPSEKPI